MRKPYTELFYHLVWATWDRLPLISPDAEPRLYGAIQSKLRELRGIPIAIGGTDNHVHCLCMMHPTISIAYLVQQAKGASSHLMTYELGLQEFKWQGAYGAFTLGRDAVPTVRAYCLDQKRHHTAGDTWPEWEEVWMTDAADAWLRDLESAPRPTEGF